MDERPQRQQARRIPPSPQPAPAQASEHADIVVGKWTAPLATAFWTATRDSITDFAARLGIGIGTIDGWKHNPSIVPTPAKQRALDKALKWANEDILRRFALLVRGNAAVWVPDSLLPTLANGAGTDRRQASKTVGAGLVAALAPLDAAERIAHAVAWPHVDAGLIDSLVAMTATLTAGNLERPCDALIEPARGHLKTVLEFLDEPMDPSDRVRLTSHAAEIALFVGWKSFNLSRNADARVSFSLAEQLAWEAGAGDALARAFASASLLPSVTFRGGVGGDTAAAVKLADQAYALAGGSPALARSWMAGRAGVEHAAAKRAGAEHVRLSMQRLDDAQQALEQAVVSGEVGEVHDGRFGVWDQPRLEGFRGTALALLGRDDEADRCLSAALTAPLHDQRRVLLLADLGLARIKNHPEQACVDLAEAYRFATSARYPNGVRRILGVRGRLEPRCATLARARELDELLGLRP